LQIWQQRRNRSRANWPLFNHLVPSRRRRGCLDATEQLAKQCTDAHVDGHTPSTMTDTLYCTIDTSIVGKEDKDKVQPGVIRKAIEDEIRSGGEHLMSARDSGNYFSLINEDSVSEARQRPVFWEPLFRSGAFLSVLHGCILFRCITVEFCIFTRDCRSPPLRFMRHE
jgi:hypothetical protein